MNDFEWELENVYKADHQATDLFGLTVNSIMKSIAPYESIKKKWIVHAPDEITLRDMRKYHKGEATEDRINTRFLDTTYKKHPERFTTIDDGTENYIISNKNYDKELDSGNLDAKDFWGYATQARDSGHYIGEPVFNKTEFTKFYPQSIDGRIKEAIENNSGRWIGDISEPLDRIIVGADAHIRPKFTDLSEERANTKAARENAKRAYEAGAISGHNGDEDFDLVKKLLIKQVHDALNSGDSNRYNAALMFCYFYPRIPQTFFNLHSGWHGDRHFVSLKSPEQVLMPDHGQAGASQIEENLHAIEQIASRIDPKHPSYLPFSEKDSIIGALNKDFKETFGNKVENAEEFFRQRKEGWKDKTDPTRYADDHELIELLSAISGHNIGGYSNHNYADEFEHREAEAFQSLINPYFTNPYEIDMLWEMFPNSMQHAMNIVKKINNIPDIDKHISYLSNKTSYFDNIPHW